MNDLPESSATAATGGDTLPTRQIYSRRWSEPKDLESCIQLEYITRIAKSSTLYEDHMEAGFHKFLGTRSHLGIGEGAISQSTLYQPGMMFSGFTIPIYTKPGLSDEERYHAGSIKEILLDEMIAVADNHNYPRSVKESLQSYKQKDRDQNLRYAHFLVYHTVASNLQHDHRCEKTNCLGHMHFDPEDEEVIECATTLRSGKYKCNSDTNLWDEDPVDSEVITGILSQEPAIGNYRIFHPDTGKSLIERSVHLYRPDLDPEGQEHYDDESDSVREEDPNEMDVSKRWLARYKKIVYPYEAHACCDHTHRA
ncbi:hypothetical protein V865_008591 [Kwoniella europaea PYCC6329]|uniref:Uncharacterized protein n=1 Tax=Kwoniella europaea PYCC6329 TaxID=1423913 RepID=A0AAX4KY79_9TREE